MAETIRAISWNVNGIRAAHKKGFVEWLGQTNPDIMCLQETKAHLDQLPAGLKEIEGYHSFFSTPERKGYSGVGLYTKTEPEQVSFGLGVEEFDKEGRVLVALGLDQHPNGSVGVLAVVEYVVFPLLGPKDDIVDVQGVGQDGLHQRFIVVLHLPGQGRDDTGATLAPAVDDHPTAPGTVRVLIRP